MAPLHLGVILPNYGAALDAERLFSVDGWMAPAPVRPGGPELWVAGVSRATLRRAVMIGVWHPVALPPDELRTMAAELRERRADSRVILRIGVYIRTEPQPGVDERDRHATPVHPNGLLRTSPSTSRQAATASS